MKPFDLKAAMAGKPVVDRNGNRVERLFFSGGETRFVAWHERSSEFVLHMNLDGTNTLNNRDFDLFMAVESKTVKIQISRRKSDGGLQFSDDAHETNEFWDVIARDVEVTFTEGQGL